MRAGMAAVPVTCHIAHRQRTRQKVHVVGGSRTTCTDIKSNGSIASFLLHHCVVAVGNAHRASKQHRRSHAARAHDSKLESLTPRPLTLPSPNPPTLPPLNTQAPSSSPLYLPIPVSVSLIRPLISHPLSSLPFSLPLFPSLLPPAAWTSVTPASRVTFPRPWGYSLTSSRCEREKGRGGEERPGGQMAWQGQIG